MNEILDKETVEKELKAFKRVLKEIGIYNYYIYERRKRVEKFDRYSDWKIFSCQCGVGFSSIIDNTLSWSETFYPELWDRLYEAARNKSSTFILNNEYYMNDLKSVVYFALAHK